jgi:hypothetical protein
MKAKTTLHFAQEDWADLARGVKEGKSNAMGNHLAAGCDKCRKSLELWARVADLGGKESSYEPPENVVRSVKGYFAIHKPAKVPAGTKIARLFFDSLISPMPVGVRAMAARTGPAARHFLYGEGACFVDLRIESQAGSNRVFVVGQVLHSAEQVDSPFRGIPVTLNSGKKALAETVTNDFGEFDLEYEARKEVVLLVKVPEQDTIGVPLPDPENSLLVTPPKTSSRSTYVL